MPGTVGLEIQLPTSHLHLNVNMHLKLSLSLSHLAFPSQWMTPLHLPSFSDYKQWSGALFLSFLPTWHPSHKQIPITCTLEIDPESDCLSAAKATIATHLDYSDYSAALEILFKCKLDEVTPLFKVFTWFLTLLRITTRDMAPTVLSWHGPMTWLPSAPALLSSGSPPPSLSPSHTDLLSISWSCQAHFCPRAFALTIPSAILFSQTSLPG